MIRKLLSLLHNKILIVTVLILIQLFVFFGIVFKLSEYFVAIYFILIALSFCMSTVSYTHLCSPAVSLWMNTTQADCLVMEIQEDL